MLNPKSGNNSMFKGSVIEITYEYTNIYEAYSKFRTIPLRIVPSSLIPCRL